MKELTQEVLSGNSVLTNGRREILKSVGRETQKETTLPHARVSDQQQLEQVIKLRLARRRVHFPKTIPNFQKSKPATSAKHEIPNPRNHAIGTRLHKK